MFCIYRYILRNKKVFNNFLEKIVELQIHLDFNFILIKYFIADLGPHKE